MEITTDLLERIYKSSIANEGSTTSISNGESPTEGYLVAVAGAPFVKVQKLTCEAIKDYVNFVYEKWFLNFPSHYLGIWFNKLENSWYITVSQVLRSKDEAVRFCKEHKYLAYYDVSKKIDVRV